MSREMVVLPSKSIKVTAFTFKSSNSMHSQMLCWTSLTMLLISTLLLALPHKSQAAAISIPISEMLREAEEPFERDDRDYRPLQVSCLRVHACKIHDFSSENVTASGHSNLARKVSTDLCNLVIKIIVFKEHI